MLLTPTMTTGDLSVSNERRGKWINPGELLLQKKKGWVSGRDSRCVFPVFNKAAWPWNCLQLLRKRPGGLALLKPEGFRSRQDTGVRGVTWTREDEIS